MDKKSGVLDAMKMTGTSCPSQARRALEKATGKRYEFKPPIGAKQKAKAAARLAKEQPAQG